MLNHKQMKSKIAVTGICLLLSLNLAAQREIQSLNGIWEVEESIDAGKVPARFGHKVRVPGLTNTATPSFEGVDRFYGREYYTNRWVQPTLMKLDIDADTMKIGYSLQKRNYFWYRKTFETKPGFEAVILKINKAQFGSMVLVNGKKAGEYDGCFTSRQYDITPYLKKKGTNVVIVRIGAHPAVLPPSVPAGNDFEKRHWTPGIYDDVSVIFTNYPYIETVQVAPDIHKGEILVSARVITRPGTETIKLTGKIREWKSGTEVSGLTKDFPTGGDSRATVTFSIPLRNARLWAPWDPFLYTLNLSTGSDDMDVRFGMREFRFDTPTKRAYLNDKLIFLRGSNITLHRFFDDSLCVNHPWEEEWVRKLLTGLPGKYNWNCFRFCIGPVPDKWFDVADEAGLLIQNEYFIWSYRPYWDRNLLKTHLQDWILDCCNHPSVAWWDINNETREPILTELISEIRSLDLSGRAWDNGYNLPEGDNDPVEDHNYKFYSSRPGTNGWHQQKFMNGMAEKTTNSPHPTAHACVLNEYGWLWLKRNGQKTLLTAPIYDSIAKGYTSQQRQELYAYLLAAETEYFRAHRNYAGVLHFDYLTGDFHGAITGDVFRDPEKLEPVEVYDEYFSEIFKPLGVYVNYFPENVIAGTETEIPVMLVNDEYHRISGNIEIRILDESGEEVANSSGPFSIAELSQYTGKIKIRMPEKEGAYRIHTYAVQPDGSKTLCRRKINITSEK